MNRPDISLVVPLYDEEDNVAVLTREIQAALADGALTWELLFVDDGSTDGTPAALAAVAAAEPRIRVLRQPENRGLSAALEAGWRHARAPVVVTLDGDLQNDPADIPRLVAKLDEGWDVVCGVRAERHDDWLRRISSRIANGVRNRLTGDQVTDVGCTLRACRAAALVDLPMFDGMHRFLPTLLGWRGARVVEVPVGHRPRRFGRPKFNVRNRLWRGLGDLLAVRWMRRRWIDRGGLEEVTASGADETADRATAPPGTAAPRI